MQILCDSSSIQTCSGKLISPVLAGSFQVLSTYVMKLFFGLYDGFPWKSIRRDADSGNIW